MEASVRLTIQKLYSSGLSRADTMQGCTNQEIQELEAKFGITLPQSYKDFLAQCGNGAGKFFVGTDWTYSKVSGLRSSAIALLRSSGSEASLSATAFVFAMHQGYQFLFFDCAVGDDPPVYLFLDGDDSPHKVFESFSRWLSRCVEDEIASYAELE